VTVRERGKLADAWAAEGQSLHMVVRFSEGQSLHMVVRFSEGQSLHIVVRFSDQCSALGGPIKARQEF
jgi:hypothetical protein